MSDPLLQYLANSYGSENDYLAQDPWFNAGRSINAMQTPAGRNDAESLLLPLLKGIIGGSVTGYGRQQAQESMYDDIRAQLAGNMNIGPVASGAEYAQDLLGSALAGKYSGEDMPDGWTAKQGKGDLLQALVGQSQLQELEQKKAEIRAQVAAQMELAQAKEGGSVIGGLGGLPKGQQDNLIGDLGTDKKVKDALSTIDKNYEKMAEVSTGWTTAEKVGSNIPLLGRMVPTPHLDEIRRLTKANVRQLDNVSGRETNSDIFKQFTEELQVDPLVDTPERIAEKRDLMKQMVINAAKGTPTLDLVKQLGVIKDQPGDLGSMDRPNSDNPPTPPAGYELTGNKNANGDWGIRKIR